MSEANQNPKINNYAFIDSQNLNLAIKNQGWVLDFGRFRRYLADKYQVRKAFLFIGYVVGNESLYTELQNAGYIVILKPTICRYDNNGKLVFIKGNVDAELVLHSMIEYDGYEKAILVSGDGDFHCLIEHLLKNGKLAHVIIPNRRKYSALLRKFRQYFIYLNGLEVKIGKNKKEGVTFGRTLGVPSHGDNDTIHNL